MVGVGAGACLGQQMVIEGVERLADFKHHVVGDVHDVADAADADFFEHAPEPIRAGADLHAANDAGGVTRTQLGVFEAHGDEVFGLRLALAGLGRLEASAVRASCRGLPVRALISRAMPMTLLRSGRLGVISRS